LQNGEFRKMKNFLSLFFLFVVTFGGFSGISKEKTEFYNFNPIYIKVQLNGSKNTTTKTKFYNFDDLLINGQYKKPQVLYTDSKQKVKFEKLLKLKKDFLPKLLNTDKDPSLR